MKRKVLIIDDTKNIRLLLTKSLEVEGYEVSSVSNGREGLEVICEKSFDLIFLDIKLPEMSGTEVLRRMRAAGVQTPVIVVTAYPTIKNAVECTRLGVVSYLQKPFTAERLANVLRELEASHALDEGDSLEAAQRALDEGNAFRALSLLGEGLGRDPQNPAAYRMIAAAYRQAGDAASADKFDKAAKLFEE